MVPMVGLSTAEAFGMWILGGVFERFRDLKVVYVEPGLGWVVWYLEVIDDMVARQGYVFDRITGRPSDYFHRNISLTFIDEPTALGKLRYDLGVENLLWSTDYPHPVTSWPDSRAHRAAVRRRADRRARADPLGERRARLEPLNPRVVIAAEVAR